jgi:hypothetical protein
MTEPSFDYDDLDTPLTLTDYIEIISNDLDEAAHNLDQREIDQLCAAIRKKLSEILRENRAEPERPATEPPERDDGYRWWDR